eukprot:7288700-Pyramimonas_sp.AAC.1
MVSIHSHVVSVLEKRNLSNLESELGTTSKGQSKKNRSGTAFGKILWNLLSLIRTSMGGREKEINEPQARHDD